MDHRNTEDKPGRKGRKTRLNRKEALHLSRAILLEEIGVPIIVLLVILTICLVVAAFSVWAWRTRIDEVAVAPGQVSPAGQLKRVESEHGGVVVEILVMEGDPVEVGQVLLVLDPTMSLSSLDQDLVQEAALLTRKARLEALIDGTEPDFSAVEAKYDGLVKQQARLCRQTSESMRVNQDILTNQIRRYQAGLEDLKNKEQIIKEQFRLISDELKTYEDLFEKNLIGKSEYFSVKRLFLQIQEGLLQIPITRAQLIERLTESENRLLKLENEARQKWVTELAGVQEELAELQEVLKRRQAGVFERKIRATDSGRAHNLQVNTVGEVIKPGETILEIVPEGAPLVAEAQIAARDIGHVRTGQPVTIKFTAYDFARYGGIKGQLIDISPTAFLSPNGLTYYKGLASIDRMYVGQNPGQNMLRPGMTVQVEIKTGSKTLIEYLMKPIYLSLTKSFRER